MVDYTLSERRFEALAVRPNRLAARMSATAVSLLGHAALLVVALFVVRPPARPPPPPPEREVLLVRAPRFVPAKAAEAVPVVAPSVTNSVTATTQPAPAPPPPPAAPAPAPALPALPAPVVVAPPQPPVAPPAPRPKVAARTPRPRPRLQDLDATPLPPQASDRATELLRAAQREAALQQAALGAAGHTTPAAEAQPAPGPTPAEEKRAFTLTLAERIRTHWVLPEGTPRDPVLVALTVRLLGAGYRLDCRPGAGPAGDTARLACAAIAAADLPQLPESLARDGAVLAVRFVP